MSSRKKAEMNDLDTPGAETTKDPGQEPQTPTLKTRDENRSRAKRFAHLLKQSEMLSNFVKSSSKNKKKKQRKSSTHKRAEESESDEVEEDDHEDSVVQYKSSPSFIKNGEMRDYQVRGLNWLISLYHNGLNGILADEMGLGKTIQTISLLGHLRSELHIPGPHLIIAPKSTIRNWMNEFATWYPPHKTIAIIGNKEDRADFMRTTFAYRKWNVCITSYELVSIELTSLKKIPWVYIVIDEAQRIKNEASLLARNVRLLKSSNRLLLTGTPLQNNLHELWALLNFLLPDLFDSAEDFDTWFDTNHCLGDETVVDRLHSILNPFLLRRIKADVEKGLLPKKELKVYVELSQMQREMYRKVLLGEMDILNSQGTYSPSRLQNILMQLRKVCNHPYLFPGAEPRVNGSFTTDTHLLHNCGKLLVLDKLLNKLKAEGSRVLLFSQFTTLLTIIEDYCWWRRHKYVRLDGQTSHEDRQDCIDEFNAPGSDLFLFLLSTRAGGLGINLTSADVVILYDSDWNPQIDLQAMDRSHRIGQKKQVRVFRLITTETVEEKIVERAEVKMHLDRIVIQQGRLVDGDRKKKPGKKDMLSMLRFGAEKILASKDMENDISDESIEAILARSWDRTQDMELKLGTMNEDELRNFTASGDQQAPLQLKPCSLAEFEGKDYSKLRGRKQNTFDDLLTLTPRTRISYVHTSASSTSVDQEIVHLNDLEWMLQRKPKIIYDFQFCSPRLVELNYQEMDYFDLQTDFEYKPSSNHDEKLDEWDKQRQKKRAAPLTPEELSEKADLLNQGFPLFSERHVRSYYKVLKQRVTIEDLPEIPPDFPQKLDFFEYHVTFMERHHELLNFHSVLKKYKLHSLIQPAVNRWTNAFNWKIGQYEDPADLEITYNPSQWLGKRFNMFLDRQLVILAQKVGFQEKNFATMAKIIEDNIAGEYQNFLRSRTVEEIHSRLVLLLHLIEQEMKEANARQASQSVNAVDKLEKEESCSESALVDFKVDPSPVREKGNNAKKRKSGLALRPRLAQKVPKKVERTPNES